MSKTDPVSSESASRTAGDARARRKRVDTVLPMPGLHWVGDGFPVRSIFSPRPADARLSPYVLMDYAGPAEFGPSARARGVGSHPHRGFETVTVVYRGEVEHRDSAGNGGRIGPGDVQWMTAGAGVLHEEMHSAEFTRRGGVLEMAQLWVNLPAKDKLTAPRYQTLLGEEMPTVELEHGAGKVRVIAGSYGDVDGAAATFTPVVLWDIKLKVDAELVLPVADGLNLAVYVRSGAVRVAGTHDVIERNLAVLSREGEGVALRAWEDTSLLVLGGEPIEEPVVAHGPFVMNTEAEIRTAIDDFQAGRLGTLD